MSAEFRFHNRPIPAVIFLSARTRGLRVAGLSLLDRLVVAMHRAGIGRITVVADGELPPLTRSRALGIEVTVVGAAPAGEVPVLVASSGLLVQTGDVRRCLEASGRLALAGGAPLPLGVAESAGADLDLLLRGVPVIQAGGVAAIVESETDAARAEQALWASLTSSSDGFVDKLFNRPCGRPLSKLLIQTPVSPNMVSVASVLIGVVSAFFFARGNYASALIGALLFQLSAVVDCVDGDIARVVFKESKLGKWIDIVGDQVVHISVFAGIALGVYRAGTALPVLWLGGAAIAGAILSFLVVLRGLRQASGNSGLLQRLIDSATNRDFSVLVLGLAAADELDIFLWLAAIGSHLFWIAALALQMPPLRRTE